jgi:hypothetical protein
MEMMNKHTSRPAQSCTSRAEKQNPRRVDYHSELRSWVQQVILEAEKNKDASKKGQFMNLLAEL